MIFGVFNSQLLESLVVSGEGSTWCSPVLWCRAQLWGSSSTQMLMKPDFKTLKGCLHPKSDLLIFLCHLCAASPHPHILTPLLASWGLCQGCPWVCWGCSSFWQQDLGVLLPFDSPGVGNSQSQSADSCLCNSGAVSSQRTAVSIRPFTWRN